MFDFRKFEIGNADSNYKLSVGNYTGTAGYLCWLETKYSVLFPLISYSLVVAQFINLNQANISILCKNNFLRATLLIKKLIIIT